MGLLRKVRTKLIPPSSKYFGDEMRNLENRLSSLERLVEEKYSNTDVQLKNTEKLLSKKLELYAMQIYRKPNESNFDASVRFFSNIPDATGPLALYQKVNSKLLFELDKICREDKLEYWMWAGSLIATASRGASIPWDDDVDICMMREDFEKLRKKLSTNNDFKVTLVYDYCAMNRQYRFWSKNPNIHNFIDIIIFDWAKEYSLKNNEIYKKLNREMEEEFRSNQNLKHWEKVQFLENTNDNAGVIKIIESIFDKYFKKAKHLGLFCDKSEANAVSYGLDGWFEEPDKTQFLWPKSVVFPLRKMVYDGIRVGVPAKNKEFCDSIYKGWPYIPDDIYTGRKHVDQATLENEDVLSAMKIFLGEN